MSNLVKKKKEKKKTLGEGEGGNNLKLPLKYSVRNWNRIIANPNFIFLHIVVNKEKRICQLADQSGPMDHRGKSKVKRNICLRKKKYLVRKLGKKNYRKVVTIISGALGTVLKILKSRLAELEVWERTDAVQLLAMPRKVLHIWWVLLL